MNWIGVWLSADPIGEAGGMNLYADIGGNPINEWDPTGLASWRWNRCLDRSISRFEE